MDSNFNPDAYLAQKSAPVFDPDTYLAEKTAPDEGALVAAGRGALRNFPGAQQLAAAAAPINPFSEKKNYSDEMQHLNEAAEASKAAHGVAYGTGAVAATAAPLLIPGVGAALESAPFIGNAALGALSAASDVNLTKPTVGDFASVGGQALMAGGIGAGLHGVGKLLGRTAAPVEKAAIEAAEKTVPAAEEMAAAAPAPKIEPKASIAGIAVPSKKVASDFTPNAQRVYASTLAGGLGGTPRQLMRIFGKENPVEALNRIGNWMDTAGPKGTSLHGLLDRPGELLEKVDLVHERSGKTIGDIIDRIGDSQKFKMRAPVGENVKLGQGMIDREGLMHELRDFALNTADPTTEARINKLISTADRLDSKPISDFRMLQQLKEMTGKQIAKDAEMSPVYGALADRMNRVVDAYGQSINNPELLAAYNKAKLDFHNASRLLPMLRYVEAREVAGGPAGHFSLRGLLSTIVNAGTDVVGLPPVEQLGKNAKLKAAPIIRNIVNTKPKSVPSNAPAVSGKLTSVAAQELANALQSKYGKEK